jgi:alanine racemase
MMRAHGYADGYMRALLDAGLVDRAEMLKVVGFVRTDVVSAELEVVPVE